MDVEFLVVELDGASGVGFGQEAGGVESHFEFRRHAHEDRAHGFRLVQPHEAHLDDLTLGVERLLVVVVVVILVVLVIYHYCYYHY